MPSSSNIYDVIVIGVGGMGSAAVYHLAKRGLRVLGLERYDVPHAMGSSHGHTRIIRMAYFEHPSYVPLLGRSYDLWRELQNDAGEQLLYITGSLDIDRAGGRVTQGSLQSCRDHGLEHEVLSNTDIMSRFPAYQVADDIQAVWQAEGGFLLSERCIVSHVVQAQANGAVVHGRERLLEWSPTTGNGVHVTTDKGEYEAGHLVFCAGAWTASFLDFLRDSAVPERQVLIWLQPTRPELFQLDSFPVFNFRVDEGHFYGFPIFGVPGMKFGRYHHLGEIVDPDRLTRECDARDEQLLRDFAKRYFPTATGPTISMTTCMFTNTPDEHFILDLHPEYPQVSIAAGFSGHGFKFASVVGEIMADLATDGTTSHDVSRFAVDRLTGG
jgi:sarcosine oxidase